VKKKGEKVLFFKKLEGKKADAYFTESRGYLEGQTLSPLPPLLLKKEAVGAPS